MAIKSQDALFPPPDSILRYNLNILIILYISHQDFQRFWDFRRSSQNSSVPPSSDLLKKPSDKSRRKKGKKRGPKYNHPGTSRNGFGTPDQMVTLSLESCPVCGTLLEPVEEAPEKVQQVAEVVEQPIEIREYRRPLYQCPNCGWSGYSSMALGVKDFPRKPS